MKQEVWCGIKVIPVMDEVINYSLNCVNCCFNFVNCAEVDCTSAERNDGLAVHFIEVDEDITSEDTSKNWMEVAGLESRGSMYYQSLLDDIGEMLGIAAYTSDGGSIQDSVLRAKVPELVAKVVYENVLLRSKIAMLEFDIDVMAL